MFKKDILFFLLLKRVGKVIAVGLFAAIVIAYIFIGSDLFLIKEVKVLNSDLIDKGNLSRFENKNIFLVRLDTLIKKINEIPEVKSVVIKKELPHKLTVEVEEYAPCALLKENMKLAVSKEGVVFPFRGGADETYPLFVYEKKNKEDLPLGESSIGMQRAMKTYLSIKDIVPVELIKVKAETEVFFLLENSKTEIRMNSEEYEKGAYYLAVLMKELPSKNVEYIDFRFGEDIVVKP